MTAKAAWNAVTREGKAQAGRSIAALFDADPQRFARFSREADGMLLDASKTTLDDAALAALFRLARARKVERQRDAMFAGKPINVTEGRAVLHTALRNRSGRAVRVDGRNVMPDVKAVLKRMGAFADAVRSGRIAGAGGQRFTDVVNIGIGGSDLGPAMATLALAPYHDGPRAHFVSNIDGAHLHDTLKGSIRPARCSSSPRRPSPPSRR